MLPVVSNRVFISYARTDRDYVERLARAISEAGFEVWYDRSIETGSSFSDRIREAIDSSAALIAVLTPESVGSKWVLREISYADQRNIPLVPLLLADCEKPIELTRLQHHDVRGGRMVGPDFVNDLIRYARRTSVEPAGGVPSHSLERSGRRGRLWLAAVLALLVLLGGAGAGYALFGRDEPATADPVSTGPAVTVAKGVPCGEGTGAEEECRGLGFCLSYSCAYIHVTTANFPGNVVCLFLIDGELMDESGQQWGPDESKDSLYWLGIPAAEVTVRCDGVEGSLVWS
jgi:hypothetical protein